MDPDVAGKRVGENIAQHFSWHWPGDEKSMIRILISIVNTTILSIANAAFACLPDHSWIIRNLWGCWDDRNGDGGPHACNVTPIFNNKTAAQWVKEVMKLHNPHAFSHRISWPTSQWHIWHPDEYVWWLEVPSPGWNAPTTI